MKKMIKKDKNNNAGEIEKKYLKLKNEVTTHNKLYYEDNNPIITDIEYDALWKKLKSYEKITIINKESLEKIVNILIEKHKTNLKGVGQPLRIALTGSKYGPGIYNIILSLDKNEVIKRLKIFN